MSNAQDRAEAAEAKAEAKADEKAQAAQEKAQAAEEKADAKAEAKAAKEAPEKRKIKSHGELLTAIADKVGDRAFDHRYLRELADEIE